MKESSCFEFLEAWDMLQKRWREGLEPPLAPGSFLKKREARLKGVVFPEMHLKDSGVDLILDDLSRTPQGALALRVELFPTLTETATELLIDQKGVEELSQEISSGELAIPERAELVKSYQTLETLDG